MAAAAATAAADVRPFIERQSISSMAVPVKTEQPFVAGHETITGRSTEDLSVR